MSKSGDFDEMDDVFLNKYSSSDFSGFYNNYLEMEERIGKLPKSVVVEKKLAGRKKEYSAMAQLYSSMVNEKNGVGLYRKSKRSDGSVCDIWVSSVIRKGELVSSFNGMNSFEGVDKEFIYELAKLSTDIDIYNKLPKLLLSKGIVLIYEKSIVGASVDGVVLRLESGVPVIGMSLRYKRLDNFWFTLLHELSHIYLHYDLLDTPIIEDFNEEGRDVTELQADRMANNSLIPKSYWRNCEAKFNPSESTIIKSADEIGVHPAIVAGRIQYELGGKSAYSKYRKIVDSIDVREQVFDNE